MMGALRISIWNTLGRQKIEAEELEQKNPLPIQVGSGFYY